MGEAFGTYVAILDHTQARAFLRTRATELVLPTGVAPARPRRGDRLGILAVRGPLFVAGAAFVGTADVLSDEGARPPSLRVSAGWTHRSLGELRGTVVPCTSRDLERVEEALLALVRRHGPAPKRPAHRRARTPGRRALLAGGAAIGRRP